ncbi:MAG: hypothetical protein RQ752_09850 [Thermohalobaculum sp.]|nr:hypothetical protein [Thermohalobaculum sp.]
MAAGPETADDPLAAYKALLRRLIDKRPSGTRQRIAEAFGTHKSFISQVTNPAYRVPLPAQHIPALFRVCHFSAEEQSAFLELYTRAHPAQAAALEELAGIERDVIHIPLPDFGDAELRAEVERIIRETAEQIIRLARHRGR